MVLVDSSVWIDYFGRGAGRTSDRLDQIIATGEPVALAGVILTEVLQGARSDQQYERLYRYLAPQPMLNPLDPTDTYARAAGLYRRCRAAGVTPRSTIDCLIAQLAIEHDARLLHDDRDFDPIAAIIPELRIA